ncbi:MAG: hypothetical protein M3014_10345 [Chloroflexota bacterium]|nr:hypothetical protein [Chloroflexota bacterium]
MTPEQNPTASDQGSPRRGHVRKPPLGEIDSWELWQALRRREYGLVLPWIILLVSFCFVLAGMYSFFFFSSILSDDTPAQFVMTLVFVAFLLVISRRISPRRGFGLAVVALIAAVSGLSFLAWLLTYILSGRSVWVGMLGTLALGLLGSITGLPALNAIGRRNQPQE